MKRRTSPISPQSPPRSHRRASDGTRYFQAHQPKVGKRRSAPANMTRPFYPDLSRPLTASTSRYVGYDTLPRDPMPTPSQNTEENNANTIGSHPIHIPGAFPSSFDHFDLPSNPRTQSSESNYEDFTRNSCYDSDDDVNETRHSHAQPSPIPAIINDILVKKIQKSLTDIQAKSRGMGYVYIMEDIDQPGLFKVGSTYDSPTQRRIHIWSTCGRNLQERATFGPMPWAELAERLCHKELHFFREKIRCTRCMRYTSPDVSAVEHREYFRAPYSVIQKSVRRWECFIKQRPYGSDGQLTGFWQRRLKRFTSIPESETHDDHVARHERWKKFVTVSYWDHVYRPFGWCADRWNGFREGYQTVGYWQNFSFYLFLASAFTLLFLEGALLNWSFVYVFRLVVCWLNYIPFWLMKSATVPVGVGKRRTSSGKHKSAV